MGCCVWTMEFACHCCLSQLKCVKSAQMDAFVIFSSVPSPCQAALAKGFQVWSFHNINVKEKSVLKDGWLQNCHGIPWDGGGAPPCPIIDPIPPPPSSQCWWKPVGWRNFPPPELDLMDLDIDLSLTRMEELVGGVLISPSKSKVLISPKSKVLISPANSKVKHLLDSLVAKGIGLTNSNTNTTSIVLTDSRPNSWNAD